MTDHLVCFTPKTGDGAFPPTGTLNEFLREEFGRKFVYTNEHGHPAIEEKLLEEFAKLSQTPPNRHFGLSRQYIFLDDGPCP